MTDPTDIRKVASLMGWMDDGDGDYDYTIMDDNDDFQFQYVAIYGGQLTAEGTLALLNYYGAHLESAIAAGKITNADAGDSLLRALKSDAALVAAVLAL